MVGSGGIKVARIFGIPIYLHASWFILFVLNTLWLVDFYNQAHPIWSGGNHTGLHTLAGVLTSLLFFASVLFHELAHSVTAQHYKIPVVSITLFVFGGVARISKEAETWKQEFNIAIAGPLSSYFLAGFFWTIGHFVPETSSSAPLALLGTLASWLTQMNFILATFNLIPGFPLDGGRIFRALVWASTRDYVRATKWAARGGQLVAYVMIVLGIWQIVSVKDWDGLWLAFIGWFLLTAAQESYAQVAMRNMLQGIRAGDIMSRDLPMVPRNTSLVEYVSEVVRTGRRCHLVEGDGRVVGLISIHAVNAVPREDWNVTSVQAAMLPRDKIVATRPDEPVLRILERMQTEDINQMPVVARVDGQERVVGLITRDSILRVLQARMEMGSIAEQ